MQVQFERLVECFQWSSMRFVRVLGLTKGGLCHSTTFSILSMVHYFLILDNEPEVGNALASMIRRRGDSATYVQDARSALEELTTARYDVAVIDGGMDVPVDGVTLTQRMENLYPSTTRLGISAVYLVRDPEADQRFHAVLSKGIYVERIYEAAGITPTKPYRGKP